MLAHLHVLTQHNRIKRRVLKQFYLAGVHFQPPAKSVQAGEKKDETDEAQPLLGGQHTWISYVHV